jgi:hypothetical protein
VVRPGESNHNTAKMNVKIAREDFEKLDVTQQPTGKQEEKKKKEIDRARKEIEGDEGELGF